MEDQKILGQRIRSFRKRAGLSQMNLEIELDASPGSLSRIENGEVNPTKETLLKIVRILNLSDSERRYLYGDLFMPASELEIESAIKSVSVYFNTKGTLAYLLDERFRFLAISKSFQKFLGFSDLQVEEAVGKSFMYVILSEKYNVKGVVSEQAYYEIIKNVLSDFHGEVGFMTDDEVYKESLLAIEEDEIVKNIWNKIVENKPQTHNTLESRKVIFSILGTNVEMSFLREPLHHDRRFEIVEFVPTHKFVKFVSNIIL